MYCINCGREMEDGVSFCSSCGTNVNAPRTESVCYAERDLGLTLILSIVLVGGGHMYMGMINKGVMYLLSAGVLLMLAVVLMVVAPIVGLFMVFVVLIFVAWTVFDAYNLAKEHFSSRGNV